MSKMPETMNEKQAALYVGLSVRTLQAYRCQLKAPAYVKIGKAVRYRKGDLERFLNENRVEPVV